MVTTSDLYSVAGEPENGAATFLPAGGVAVSSHVGQSTGDHRPDVAMIRRGQHDPAERSTGETTYERVQPTMVGLVQAASGLAIGAAARQ